jgi:DNA-binding MarR family transcriptional regulator
MAAPKRVLGDTIDKFWETVPPLWSMIRSQIRATARADFGITVEQFHVLRYVRRGKESVSELAEAKNISRSAISQAVEVLVQKGLVSRSQSEKDRRFVELTLTREGEALLDGVFSKTREWMQERMSGLSADELERIGQSMMALRKML